MRKKASTAGRLIPSKTKDTFRFNVDPKQIKGGTFRVAPKFESIKMNPPKKAAPKKDAPKFEFSRRLPSKNDSGLADKVNKLEDRMKSLEKKIDKLLKKLDK